MKPFEKRERRKKSGVCRTVKCANCGKMFDQTDLDVIADAIFQNKPACSYKCNKALGQVKE